MILLENIDRTGLVSTSKYKIEHHIWVDLSVNTDPFAQLDCLPLPLCYLWSQATSVPYVALRMIVQCKGK